MRAAKRTRRGVAALLACIFSGVSADVTARELRNGAACKHDSECESKYCRNGQVGTKYCVHDTTLCGWPGENGVRKGAKRKLHGTTLACQEIPNLGLAMVPATQPGPAIEAAAPSSRPARRPPEEAHEEATTPTGEAAGPECDPSALPPCNPGEQPQLYQGCPTCLPQ